MEVGEVLSGKYRLLRLLGDGGMGSVYEAQHELLGTRVAIKVLHPELMRKTGLVERFLREARVAAQIRSPHVVQVTDVEQTPNGVAYLVMELLEGEALSSVLDRQRKVPVATSIDYTLQILTALEAAHSLGVIHRDLKPENVFVTFVGGRAVVKLIDFGIAKLKSTDPGAKSLTIAGVMMGTAEYMAPEQAFSADKADARSDLYAVGVMLYEMIAGVRPVDGDDARVIAMKIERGEVKPLVHTAPEVQRELAGLVHRAMAARPELRFATATEMRLALEAVAKRMPSQAPPRAQGVTAATFKVDESLLPRGAAMSAVADPMLGGSTARVAPVEIAPSTERAPPIGAIGAMAPAMNPNVTIGRTGAPVTPMPPMYPMAGPTPAFPLERRRAKSFPWWLVVIPLLLGAGVVVALVVSNEASSIPPAPTAILPTTPPATPTNPPTIPPAPPPTVDTLAPLSPGRPTPYVAPRPTPRPSASTSGAQPSATPPALPNPAPSASASPPPTTEPSPVFTLPFPLPSGTPPFAIPSSLPGLPPFLPEPPPVPPNGM